MGISLTALAELPALAEAALEHRQGADDADLPPEETRQERKSKLTS